MTDYIVLGMMKAEFEAACAAIDERADAATQDSVRSAFASLMAGDLEGRDKGCDLAGRALDAKARAKKEAWYRIGEKYGISREQADSARAKLYN